MKNNWAKLNQSRSHFTLIYYWTWKLLFCKQTQYERTLMSVNLCSIMNLFKPRWPKAITIYFGSHGCLQFVRMSGGQVSMYKTFQPLLCVNYKASHMVKPRFKGWRNSPTSWWNIAGCKGVTAGGRSAFVAISLATIALVLAVAHIPSDGPWGDILEFMINGTAYM